MISNTVAVLMSTYNGENFLAEQIESILSQIGVDVAIHIRDDGSSDGTPEILRQYSNRHNVFVKYGSNLGPARSFMSLLHSTSGYLYYAFADQDDIWLPEKLERAVDVIQKQDNFQPFLYLANAIVVNSDCVGSSLLVSTHRRPGLENALIQCFSIGASMVFNDSARSIVDNHAVPMKITMHDWWLYLVVSALGKTLYDPKPTMLYRQHENNLFGDAGDLKYFFRNWRKILSGQSMTSALEQAKDLLGIYRENLAPEQKYIIENFAYVNTQAPRIVSAFKQPIYKKSRVGTLAAKIQWVAGFF